LTLTRKSSLKKLLLHRRPPYRRPDLSGGRKVRTPQRSIAGNTRRFGLYGLN